MKLTEILGNIFFGRKREIPLCDQRKAINQIVREFAIRNGGCYEDTWNRIYREFNKRNHCYVKARARHRKCRPLDIVEGLGLLSMLILIAHEILV